MLTLVALVAAAAPPQQATTVSGQRVEAEPSSMERVDSGLGRAGQASRPGGSPITIMPEFSWETLPVAFHSCNSTGRYSAAQIAELARYQMVTIEKWQNLGHIAPTATLVPPYSSPGGLYACQASNGSLSRCGCCAEDEIVAVARSIKQLNPKVVTVAYLNAQISYPWYRASRELAANPSWWLRNTTHAGPVGSTWKMYDLTVAAAAQSWKDACLNLTRTGVVDSCFVDGCTERKGSARLADAKAAMITQLQAEVAGPLLCGTNEGADTNARGLQDEGWGVVNKRSQRTSFATREIPAIMAAAAQGKVFQAHGRAVCGSASVCENNTAPCWSNPLPAYTSPEAQVRPQLVEFRHM